MQEIWLERQPGRLGVWQAGCRDMQDDERVAGWRERQASRLPGESGRFAGMLAA
jgi:hypothetical protein